MSFVYSFELSVKHTYLFAANLAYGNYNFPFSTFNFQLSIAMLPIGYKTKVFY
jgi:hypothetical protein